MNANIMRPAASYDSVAITGSIIGLASTALGWLTLKLNRLAAGTSLSLWESLGGVGAAIIIALWLLCLIFSLRQRGSGPPAVLGTLANLVVIITFVAVGQAASRLVAAESPFTRVSLGAGVWTTVVAAYIVIFASRRRLAHVPSLQYLVSLTGIAGFAILLFAGWLDHISVVQEFHANQGRFMQELGQHVLLFGASVVGGTLIGVPLGIWAERSRRAERPIFIIANITQTIPSLALFGLLIAPLSALSFAFPVLREFGIRGVGAAPALIALTLYALLPIVQNTYIGLRQIDPGVIDAGQGMGMSRRQLFLRLEAPLAAPLVLEGVRTASVQAVGNAAVAALIGAGGLGLLIFQGLGQAAPDLNHPRSATYYWSGTNRGRCYAYCGYSRHTPGCCGIKMIRLEAVVKYYGNTLAVDHLSFQVNAGEVCVLIGPSGCGKTTTLRMINRLIEPTSGRILVDGQDVSQIKPEQLRQSIGYAIQSVGLFPHMTVAANIAIVPELLHWEKQRIARRVAEMLRLVGLDPVQYAGKYPVQMSGGEAQRVGVARALAADPPILLMDEPFGAVDPLTRTRLQAQFVQIQRQLHKCVILVTHDLDEAIRLADRIAVMASGKLVQYDTPEAILSRPANKFVHDFVGTDRALKRISRISIDRFIKPAPSIAISRSIAEAVAATGDRRWVWVVDDQERLIGWLDKTILPVATSVREATVVGDAREIAVGRGATLRDALSVMLGQGFKFIPVVDEDRRLVGEVALRDIEAATTEAEV